MRTEWRRISEGDVKGVVRPLDPKIYELRLGGLSLGEIARHIRRAQIICSASAAAHCCARGRAMINRAIRIVDLRCDKCGSDKPFVYAPGSDPDRVLGPDTLPVRAGAPMRCRCLECWAKVEAQSPGTTGKENS